MKASLALYLLPLVAAKPFAEPVKQLQARDVVCKSYGCGYQPPTTGTATAVTGQKYTVYAPAFWSSGVSLIKQSNLYSRQQCVDLCGQTPGCVYWHQFIGNGPSTPYCEVFRAASTFTQPTCWDKSSDFESGKLI